MYAVAFPNLLISLHPDYVMTHTLRPLSADRTFVECSWAFPREVAERPGFDPSYAVDFWDLTNRQDWAACESVQRGLTSPHAIPGPAGARGGRRLPVRQPRGSRVRRPRPRRRRPPVDEVRGRRAGRAGRRRRGHRLTSELLTSSTIDDEPGDLVRRCGTVVAEFGHLTQDSGNVSWLVDVGDRRLFVKTAGRTGETGARRRRPVLRPRGPRPAAAERRRAGGLVLDTRRCPGCSTSSSRRPVPPSSTRPRRASWSTYDGTPAVTRPRPTSGSRTCRRTGCSASSTSSSTSTSTLAAAGWVACDLYDGCLIVDLETGSLKVVDLDTYRRGPSVNDMGRMFGATRFMAPEEFELGAVIDERTTCSPSAGSSGTSGPGSPSGTTSSAAPRPSPRSYAGPAGRCPPTGTRTSRRSLRRGDPGEVWRAPVSSRRDDGRGPRACGWGATRTRRHSWGRRRAGASPRSRGRRCTRRCRSSRPRRSAAGPCRTTRSWVAARAREHGRAPTRRAPQ